MIEEKYLWEPEHGIYAALIPISDINTLHNEWITDVKKFAESMRHTTASNKRMEISSEHLLRFIEYLYSYTEGKNNEKVIKFLHKRLYEVFSQKKNPSSITFSFAFLLNSTNSSGGCVRVRIWDNTFYDEAYSVCYDEHATSNDNEREFKLSDMKVGVDDFKIGEQFTASVTNDRTKYGMKNKVNRAGILFSVSMGEMPDDEALETILTDNVSAASKRLRDEIKTDDVN